jgi:outer membrane protein TolC
MLFALNTSSLRTRRICVGVLALAFLSSSAYAQPERAPAPIPTYTLGECIQIARENSPVLKAAAASLLSAQAGQNGVNAAARFTHEIIAPDIEYRKQQAANGVRAAEAELMQAEHDVTYEVIRVYYTVVYAREQVQVATDLANQLNVQLDQVKKAVQEGVRGVSLNLQNQVEIYRAQAVTKQIEAQSGYERALKALAHEMSVEEDHRFDVADRTLPEIKADGITRDAVVGHALCRRGEIALASIGADVLRLEVSAQGAIRFRLRSFTAAAGGDVHSRNVPQGTREGEYRPSAIAPEYPVLFVGNRKARVAKAEALSMRADAVFQKTRDLILLEAENGYLRFQEAARKVDVLKAAAQSGRDLIARSRKPMNGNILNEEHTRFEALAAQAIASYNESHYQQLLSLAALERITAGGVRVRFPGR